AAMTDHTERRTLVLGSLRVGTRWRVIKRVRDRTVASWKLDRSRDRDRRRIELDVKRLAQRLLATGSNVKCYERGRLSRGRSAEHDAPVAGSEGRHRQCCPPDPGGRERTTGRIEYLQGPNSLACDHARDAAIVEKGVA